MLKEALAYLVGLGKNEMVQVGEQQFSTQKLNLVHEETASALSIRNLTGLVDYLTENYDNLQPVLVQVVSPTQVDVYSTFNRDMNRSHFLRATAQLPDIRFGHWNDLESFNIMLQSQFVPTQDSATLLRIAGTVTSGDVKTVGDTGVSQQVTVKKGVATVSNEIVPNPVSLKPFRTFVEIEQPESAFVFRMKDGGDSPYAALHEADGGAWKVQAIHSIRDYLAEALAEKIKTGDVTIIA